MEKQSSSVIVETDGVTKNPLIGHEFRYFGDRFRILESSRSKRLLFVDECGLHTSLGPIYGYAPRGERLCLSVPRNRGKNTTLLCSMAIDGMARGSSFAIDYPTTRGWSRYVFGIEGFQ